MIVTKQPRDNPLTSTSLIIRVLKSSEASLISLFFFPEEYRSAGKGPIVKSLIHDSLTPN